MAEDKKGRTQYLEENMKPGMAKDIITGISRVGDALGFKQEKEYTGKSTEELAKKPTPEKKAKGGTVGSASKRADGIAARGKTRGRMV